MAKPNAYQGKDLILYFIKKYEEKYGNKIMVNIHQNKWAFADIVDQLDMSEAKKLVDYYFMLHSDSGHSVDAFLKNYDKVYEMLIARRKRDERSRLTMQQTKIRAEQWEKKYGKSGNGSNQLGTEE